jgi:predicted choloylglycine hydrolase
MRLHNLSGSHRDVGLAIGKTFAQQIRKTLAGNTILQKTFLPFHRTAEGKRKYQELVQLHEPRFPDYLSELRGISEGAGVPFEELFLVNMRGGYRGYAAESADSGCSTCSLLTPDNAMFAHNEDGSPIYQDRMYLVRLEIMGKPAFTALCYPGFLPGNAFGFNSEGVCFSANNVLAKRIATGLGRHFIARSLFEARSLEEAIQLATVSGRASGFNYTIGSFKERRIVNVEVSPNRHNVFEIKGFHFHANHYIKLSDVDQLITPSSQARQHRAEALLAEGVARDRTGVLKVLRDRQVKNYPILRDGKPPDGSMTFVTAMFDLDSKKLTIYPGGVGRMNHGFEPLIEISMGE